MNTDHGSIGIVGAGVMGRSIALCAARAGFDVRLFDAKADAAQSAAEGIAESAGTDVPPPQVALQLDALGDCDSLIEAVVENRSVKRRVLSALQQVAPNALLATNTSSLSITELGAALEFSSRFCGMHFCHPIAECPLVEIVAGPTTDTETLGRAESFVRSLGLQPLRTRDVPGFAVNRLLFPYMEAAVALVRGGVDWQRIERTALEFGMRLGPLAQMDEIGIDVILRAAAAFHRGNPAVPPQSELLLAMFQSGRLGRKSGCGFYAYSDSGQPWIDAQAVELATGHFSEPLTCPDDELALRLFIPLAASACELVASAVVEHADDVQKALTGGLGCHGQAADLAAWIKRVTPAALRDCCERFGLAVPELSAVERLLAG